jgi:cell division protein FtsZ
VLFSIAGGDDLTMFEIQDAAKVITESVDPNARIIFGTVRDEKIKKGELRITVIASNFPEAVQRRATSLFAGNPAAQAEEDKRGKIFNSFSGSKEKFQEEIMGQRKPEPVQSQVQPPQPAPVPPIDDTDDDWGAVPAFLRRSKLK